MAAGLTPVCGSATEAAADPEPTTRTTSACEPPLAKNNWTA
ncbi:hypothetical protein ACI797_11530 [Geodermatophilus sp. SYSU D00691]